MIASDLERRLRHGREYAIPVELDANGIRFTMIERVWATSRDVAERVARRRVDRRVQIRDARP